MRFGIIDVSNLVHRAKHAVGRSKSSIPDPFGEEEEQHDEKVALILTVFFMSLYNAANRFGIDHFVAAFDARSWRRDYYPEYKANRRSKIKTPAEEAEREMIVDAINEVETFLREFTNVTVLMASSAEADDMIARWVQLHHDDVFEHVIISADSDFKQLVRPGVDLYNPMSYTLSTAEGVFYQDGKKIAKDTPTVERYGDTWKVKLDKKTGESVTFDPSWELFEKCIRGDTSDNITTAWRGVRTTKMQKAFYGDVTEWNNFINSTWGDGDNKKSVRELYDRNRVLIDLRAQPAEVIEEIDIAISDALERKPSKFVGAHFAKFCATKRLKKLSNMSSQFTSLLTKSY